MLAWVATRKGDAEAAARAGAGQAEDAAPAIQLKMSFG